MEDKMLKPAKDNACSGSRSKLFFFLYTQNMVLRYSWNNFSGEGRGQDSHCIYWKVPNDSCHSSPFSIPFFPCVCWCVCVCVARSMLVLCLHHSPPYSFEAGSINQIQSLLITSQLDSGIPCFHLLRQEGQASLHTHLAFIWVLGIQTLSFPLCGKWFNCWAISISPHLISVDS